MSNIDPVPIVRAHITTYVVPGFIYEAAKKANLHLMDLSVYDKVRQVCSLEDLAVYAYIHDNMTVGVNCKITSLSLGILMKTQEAQEKEADLTLRKMSRTEEIKKIAESYLSEPAAEYAHLVNLSSPSGEAKVIPNTNPQTVLGNGLDQGVYLPYQLKTEGSNVFVIVGPGFCKYVGISGAGAKSQTFVRDFIKHCDGLYSPAEVAQHPLFQNFLTFLSA